MRLVSLSAPETIREVDRLAGLYAAVFAELPDSGNEYRAAWLLTLRDLNPAEAFYEQLGWTTLGEGMIGGKAHGILGFPTRAG